MDGAVGSRRSLAAQRTHRKCHLCYPADTEQTQCLERISVEMVFRVFYHYSRALTRGETMGLVPYLVQHAPLLGLVKRQRQRHRDIQHTEQLV